MTQQDYVDAFILWFSGAGNMKSEREMWFDSTQYTNVTVEFPTNTTTHHITRKYRHEGNHSLHWEVECMEGVYTKGDWWGHSDIRYYDRDGKVTMYMVWRDGAEVSKEQYGQHSRYE